MSSSTDYYNKACVADRILHSTGQLSPDISGHLSACAGAVSAAPTSYPVFPPSTTTTPPSRAGGPSTAPPVPPMPGSSPSSYTPFPITGNSPGTWTPPTVPPSIGGNPSAWSPYPTYAHSKYHFSEPYAVAKGGLTDEFALWRSGPTPTMRGTNDYAYNQNLDYFGKNTEPGTFSSTASYSSMGGF